MARKKRDRDTAPASAASEASGETIGGSSVVDEGLKPLLFQVMEGMAHHLADWQPVDRMLRELSPAVRSSVKLVPSAVGMAVGKMPIAWFKSPDAAEFVGDTVKEIAEMLNRIVQAKGVVTPDEAGEVVKTALETVRAKKVLRDPVSDGYHTPSCEKMRAFLVAFKAEADESTLGEMLDHGTPAMPCCHQRVVDHLRVALPQPEPAKTGRLSFLQRLGKMPPGKLRNMMVAWVNEAASDPARLPRLLEALGEIDEDGEMEAIALLKSGVREKLVPALRSRNATHGVMDAVRALGKGLKDFDDSLAPRVSARVASRATKPRSRLGRLIRGSTL